eukprot:scaffold30760_cov30-Phaeocystis_antarctica.AAC.3
MGAASPSAASSGAGAAAVRTRLASYAAHERRLSGRGGVPTELSRRSAAAGRSARRGRRQASRASIAALASCSGSVAVGRQQPSGATPSLSRLPPSRRRASRDGDRCDACHDVPRLRARGPLT